MTTADVRAVILPRGLPAGPESAAGRRQHAEIRPLTGHEEELLAERGTASVAETVTALLHRCVVSLDDAVPSPEDIRDLTVGDREALLLHVRAGVLGDRIDGVVSCHDAECGERIDLELRGSDLLVDAYPEALAWHEEEFDGVLVRFRLPTGADQEAVASLAAADPAEAGRRLLDRCIVDPGADLVPDEVREAVAGRMAELDPQAELRLSFGCPNCRSPIEMLFDTASFFFAEMAAGTARLYEEVHALAWYYHWPLSEILDLPPRARRRYLDLIAGSLRPSQQRGVA